MSDVERKIVEMVARLDYILCAALKWATWIVAAGLVALVFVGAVAAGKNKRD